MVGYTHLDGKHDVLHKFNLVMRQLINEFDNEMSDTTKRICISNLYIMSRID